MAILTFNDDSLRRGNVSQEEIKEALDDPLALEVEEGQSLTGNPTVIYVGMTFAERLLEIGVEYANHETHIFHARKANAQNQAKYENQ